MYDKEHKKIINTKTINIKKYKRRIIKRDKNGREKIKRNNGKICEEYIRL